MIGGPAYSAGSSTEKFASHANRMGASDDAVDRILNTGAGFNAGRFTRYSEDWYAVLNALGMCVRLQMNRFHSIGSLAELYSAATGLEMSPEELRKREIEAEVERLSTEEPEVVASLLRAWLSED